jgi:hypothetical protein
VATHARFGRLPRTAPSLTAAIVAAAREYQAMRERNIQSAWQKGGDFEGKQVTDEKLMGFFKQKLSQLSPDDPTANDVRNTITQYEFSIANSKQELLYAQKKVSDVGMADFYRNWAAKLPVNSEAYRERAKLAAQYMDRANSKASAGRRQAADKAYGIHQDTLYNHTQMAYDTVLGSMIATARSGIKGTILPVLDTSKETFADIRVAEGDANSLLEIVNLVAHDPSFKQWRDGMTKQIRAIESSNGGTATFNGDFSYSGLLSLNRRAQGGLTQAINYARKQGRSTSSFEKKRSEVKGLFVTISTIDERAIYEDARASWSEIVNDPSTSISQKWEANQTYNKTLGTLYDRAKAAGDDNLAGAFNTEYMATMGAIKHGAPPSLWESSRRSSTAKHPAEGGDPSSGDAQSTNDSVNAMATNLDRLMQKGPDGRPLYVQVHVDQNGVPTSSKDGQMGVVPAAVIPNAAFYVTNADSETKMHIGGGAVSAGDIISALVPTPVVVVPMRTDAISGAHQSTVGDKVPVGNRYTLDDGSQAWSFIDSSGATKFSVGTNPFTSAATATANGDEIVTPVYTDADANRLKANPPKPSQFTIPNYWDAASNARMPNTVVNSIPAAEMVASPHTAYGKYTPSSIVSLAQAQSGGDPAKYATVYGELDGLRAQYINSGGLEWDDQVRLLRAHQNGDLPLLADYQGYGKYGFSNMYLAPDEVKGKEGAALQNLLGPNLAAWDTGAGPSSLSTAAQQRASDLASRTSEQFARMTTPAALQPTDSRDLANNLIRNIWGQVYSNPGGIPNYTSGYMPNPQQAVAPSSITPTGPSVPSGPPLPAAPGGQGTAATSTPAPSGTPYVNPYTGFTTPAPITGPATSTTPVVNAQTGFTTGSKPYVAPTHTGSAATRGSGGRGSGSNIAL